MYCTNCGAEIEATDARCPYCGMVNPYGAERAHMRHLEGIRKQTEALSNAPSEALKGELRSNWKKAGRIVLTAAAVIVGIIIFIFLANRFTDMLLGRSDVRAEMAFREEYFPQLDALYEQGDDDATLELMSSLFDKPGSTILFEWNHYAYISAYWDLVTVRTAARHIAEGDYEDLCDYLNGSTLNSAFVILKDPYEDRFKMTSEERVKADAFREEVSSFFTETLGCTESETEALYEKCCRDDYFSYSACEEAARELVREMKTN